MRLFYILLLFLGICLAVVMQLVSIAIPSDAFVAGVLSRTPDQWSIQMEESMDTRLSDYDVKAELVTALHKRAMFASDICKQYLWSGLVLIVFSIIGLIRENKIRNRQGLAISLLADQGHRSM